MGTKTLVVYFSATGATKLLAEYAAEILNADLYEIVPEDPYMEEDLVYYTNGWADQEQNDPSIRPGISGSVENMEEYNTIILGYPICSPVLSVYRVPIRAEKRTVYTIGSRNCVYC